MLRVGFIYPWCLLNPPVIESSQIYGTWDRIIQQRRPLVKTSVISLRYIHIKIVTSRTGQLKLKNFNCYGDSTLRFSLSFITTLWAALHFGSRICQNKYVSKKFESQVGTSFSCILPAKHQNIPWAILMKFDCGATWKLEKIAIFFEISPTKLFKRANLDGIQWCIWNDKKLLGQGGGQEANFLFTNLCVYLGVANVASCGGGNPHCGGICPRS